jgi:hypothetical protein
MTDLSLLEALLDPRIGSLPAAAAAGLDPELVQVDGDLARLRPDKRAEAELMLTAAVRERPIEWASLTTTQGELFDALSAHFRDELDEVELHAATPTALDVGWRRERATVELRASFVECERLAAERPAIVLGPLDDTLSERLAAEPRLRERLVVYDLAALSKAGAVRSSVAVFLEWFLRDAYGVKVLASAAFTQGLVSRGVISLGMG